MGSHLKKCREKKLEQLLTITSNYRAQFALITFILKLRPFEFKRSYDGTA